LTSQPEIVSFEDSIKAMEPLRQSVSALGIELVDAQLDKFYTYYKEMVDWNQRVNLTGITEFQDVLTKHYLDSLSVSLALSDELKSNGSFIDVGTGAGFPGIPLCLAFPGMGGTLLDATGKKTIFLEYIVEILGLDRLSVVKDRAETLAMAPEHREVYDIVLGRGLAGMAAFAELTLPFAKVGGLVIAQKLTNSSEEIAAASNAIELLGGELKEIIQVAQKGLENRALVVVKKIMPTPMRYPRRPGSPSKNPL
jgi:16S rRNA (guanine527-N7)-methyltransferase